MSGTDGVERQGLQFFGRMTASAAHEIKNVLAIINENAGLLADLVTAAGRGAAIDPARLGRLAQDLARQVQRADAIMKNLHRLAHSVDEARATVDLVELVTLVCGLGARLAYAHGRSLEPVAPGQAVAVTTDPLVLENLVWECLDFSARSTDSAAVRAIVAATAAGAEIRFTPVTRPAGPFPAPRAQALAAALDARLVLDAPGQCLVLSLPAGLAVSG